MTAGAVYKTRSYTQAGLSKWILDSGATDHICCSLEFLSDVTKLDHPHPIMLGNGKLIFATHIGQLYPYSYGS